MKGTPIINLVATECRPEDEEKFNRWYEQVHIPMLFKFKGMTKVTRCRLAGNAQEHPKYLAIYEFESQEAYESYQRSPELAAAREEMKGTWKGEGFKIKWRLQYEPVKTWTR